MQKDKKKVNRENEHREQRREFLKKTLVTSAYVAPVVLSFSTKDLVKAASGSQSAGSAGSPGPAAKPKPKKK